jgi:hypothetical protein
VVAIAVALIAVLAQPRPGVAPEIWTHDPGLVALAGNTPRGIRLTPQATSRLALEPVDVDVPGVVMVRVAGW